VQLVIGLADEDGRLTARAPATR